MGVDADDGRLGGGDVAQDQSNGRLDAAGGCGNLVVARLGIGNDALEAEDAEVPPAGGEVGIGELANG